jgi:hypothetical protein
MFENLGAMIGSTGGAVQPGTGDVSQGTGALGWIEQNPEQFAMVLDAIGSRINPDSPFAGTATKFAQSALASKAANEVANQNQSLGSSLSGLVAGDQQMTAPGIPGLSSATIKPGQNGTNELTLSLTQPKAGTKKGYMNQSGLSPAPF